MNCREDRWLLATKEKDPSLVGGNESSGGLTRPLRPSAATRVQLSLWRKPLLPLAEAVFTAAQKCFAMGGIRRCRTGSTLNYITGIRPPPPPTLTSIPAPYREVKRGFVFFSLPLTFLSPRRENETKERVGCVRSSSVPGSQRPAVVTSEPESQNVPVRK